MNYFDNPENKLHRFFGKDTATPGTIQKKNHALIILIRYSAETFLKYKNFKVRNWLFPVCMLGNVLGQI